MCKSGTGRKLRRNVCGNQQLLLVVGCVLGLPSGPETQHHCTAWLYSRRGKHPNSLWIYARHPAEQIHRWPISPENKRRQDEDKRIQRNQQQKKDGSDGDKAEGIFLVVESLMSKKKKKRPVLHLRIYQTGKDWKKKRRRPTP